MSTVSRLRHEFVEYIPEGPENGVLYVSMAYATAVHNCCCGCGREVVTPFSPTDWKLVFDGESVSLTPSIGNWSFDCQSHYWIERDVVRWAGRWSREEIDAGRKRDQIAKAHQHRSRSTAEPPVGPARAGRSWWGRMADWLFGPK